MPKDFRKIIYDYGEDDFKYNPVSTPIYETSIFTFASFDDFKQGLKEKQFNYTRGFNPTVRVLERKLAALEGGQEAKFFASGISAVSAAVMSQLKKDDHVISVNDCYSWTHSLFKKYLPRFGVETTFVDGRQVTDFKEALKENTRVIFLESPTTFTFNLQDLEAVCNLATEKNIVTIIDNSWATPLFQNPIDFGVDIVVASASKYIGGHSDVVGGYLVCKNKEMFEHIFDTEFMNIGAVPGPFESWLFIRGLRTLPLRLETHMNSALAVVDFLESHKKIEYVSYPYHPAHPQYNLALKQMRGGTGLFSFRINTTSTEKIKHFTDELKIFKKGVSWGGYESLIAPCALDNSLEGTQKAGVIRIHIGLEGSENIIADLNHALKNI